MVIYVFELLINPLVYNIRKTLHLKHKQCDVCKGHGKVYNFWDVMQIPFDCPYCKGRGYI
jgi:DnaJ-class molecular chaperone